MPFQGTPGVWDPRNPTLLPNFDSPVATTTSNPEASIIQKESAADFAARVVAASGSLTVGGTTTTDDIITMILTNPSFIGGSISIPYTVVAGDADTEDLANHLVDAVNANATAKQYGIYAQIDPAGAGESVFKIYQPGLVGNSTTFSRTLSVGASETLTSSATFSGGSGPVFCYNNFNFADSAGQIQSFFAGKLYNLSVQTVKTMVAQGMPIA